MAEVIKLKAARKARERAARQAQAAANRMLHGRTKAQRTAEAEARARRDGLLDGAKRERSPDVVQDDGDHDNFSD